MRLRVAFSQLLTMSALACFTVVWSQAASAQAGTLNQTPPVFRVPQRVPIPPVYTPPAPPTVPQDVRCTDVSEVYYGGGILFEGELYFTCVDQAGGGKLRVKVASYKDISDTPPPADIAELTRSRYRDDLQIFATILGTFMSSRAAGRVLVLDLNLFASKIDKKPVVSSLNIRG